MITTTRPQDNFIESLASEHGRVRVGRVRNDGVVPLVIPSGRALFVNEDGVLIASFTYSPEVFCSECLSAPCEPYNHEEAV